MIETFKDIKIVGQCNLHGTDLESDGQSIDGAVAATALASPTLITDNFVPMPTDHHNRTLLIDTSTGLTVELQSAIGSGALYRFIVLNELSSGSLVFQVRGNTPDFFIGSLNRFDIAAANVEYSPLLAQRIDSFDTITFTATSTGGQSGDEIIFQDIAPNTWFLGGRVMSFDPSAVGSIFTSVVSAA